jgi:hypothetical protein
MLVVKQYSLTKYIADQLFCFAFEYHKLEFHSKMYNHDIKQCVYGMSWTCVVIYTEQTVHT